MAWEPCGLRRVKWDENGVRVPQGKGTAKRWRPALFRAEELQSRE